MRPNNPLRTDIHLATRAELELAEEGAVIALCGAMVANRDLVTTKVNSVDVSCADCKALVS